MNAFFLIGAPLALVKRECQSGVSHRAGALTNVLNLGLNFISWARQATPPVFGRTPIVGGKMMTQQRLES
jgi:hypothetical protein